MPGALSERESEVLALLGEHLSHAEIAERLVVSVRTVESHVASARRKLGIDGHRELVRYAAEHRPRAGRLPRPLTPFIGRAAERAALRGIVRDRRLVSLVGPGGVGKTRLAIGVARDLADEYAGRVWFADLVPVTESVAVPGAVVTACGVGHLPGRFPEDVLVRGLGGPPGLLLLDNCEHLLDAVALLAERLLSDCPGLHLLLTSRARLALPFEHVHHVEGLVGEGDGIELFEQRARTAGAPPLDASDRARAVAVCDAVGGLALAIELAAVRLPALGLDGLEEGLTGQLDLLVGGARLSPRQRSMEETLDWSLRLLDDSARAVLARLACFAGGFDVAAAVAVAAYGEVPANAVREALAALVEQSLVVALGPRRRLLEPVRQYAADHAGPGDADARRRHLQWTATRCEELLPRPEDDAVPELADEVRAAVGWASGRAQERPAASMLSTALAELLFRRGAVRDAQMAFEQAAALADEPGDRAALLTSAASAARCRVLGEEALRLGLLALDAARASGDEPTIASSLANVAETILRFEGMFSEPPPQALARAVVDELEALAPRQSAAYAAMHLVRTWSEDPQAPDAGEAGRGAVQAARESGDPVRVSAALDVVTFLQVIAGRLAAAEATAQLRLSALGGLPTRPAVALELKDALHMAVQLDCGTGELTRAVAESRRHRGLPFLREQRDLAVEPVLLPLALAGHHDELFAAAEEFADDWAASGRPVAPARAVGPYAVAVAHGMRGHDDESRRWYDLVAAMTDRPTARAGRGTGYAVVLDALLMLHRDQPDRALDALSASAEPASEWYARLCAWWASALRAEAAVLTRARDAPHLLDEAEATCSSSPVLSVVVRRARAVSAGDRATLAAVADRFGELGAPYQQERTRHLATS